MSPCSHDLLVQSRCWLLYVLGGWCTATVTICCWRSPVPASTPLLPPPCEGFYVRTTSSATHIRTKCSCKVHGLNTLDLYRHISPEAEIKSLLESVLSGPSHRSHSVLLWDLIGKAGKVMGGEELKIYNHAGTCVFKAGVLIMKCLLEYPTDRWHLHMSCLVCKHVQFPLTYDKERHQIFTLETTDAAKETPLKMSSKSSTAILNYSIWICYSLESL